MAVKLKRAYEAAAPEDGDRYLVERLWPRGVKRDELRLTDWLRDLAPSRELRTWYGHDPAKHAEFVQRYEAELAAADKQDTLRMLAEKAKTGDLTLVFASRDEEQSSALVLKRVLECMAARA